jgi:hypothetical protein
MSSIGSRIGMIHTCDLLRNGGATNSWGGKDVSFTTHIAGQICRAWTASESLDVGDDKILTMNVRYVIVPLGTDVTEDDRVGNIYLRDGTVLWPGPHTIDEVEIWEDRLELTLRQGT